MHRFIHINNKHLIYMNSLKLYTQIQHLKSKFNAHRLPNLFSNSQAGKHPTGNITYEAAEVIAERYLLGTLNLEGTRVSVQKNTAVVGGGMALGVISDTATKAGDYINMQLLGAQAGTTTVLAGGDIQAGDALIADATGKAVALKGQVDGAYYICGIAIKPARANALVEFVPTLGLQSKP